jgi:hypothetical protein
MNSVVAPELISPIYTIHTVVVFINSQWDLEPFLHGVPEDGSDNMSIGRRQGRPLALVPNGLMKGISGSHSQDRITVLPKELEDILGRSAVPNQPSVLVFHCH